jgi:hypothetical protein
MRVTTAAEFNHPAMHAVQQVGQTLTENIFRYIFRQYAENFPAITHAYGSAE